jgi:hypothetical protein
MVGEGAALSGAAQPGAAGGVGGECAGFFDELGGGAVGFDFSA